MWWANMSIYRDTYGDGLWRCIPFDMNASWGQLYGGSNPLEATDDNSSHRSTAPGNRIVVQPPVRRHRRPAGDPPDAPPPRTLDPGSDGEVARDPAVELVSRTHPLDEQPHLG
jgi:hypothetical protein